MTPPRSSGELIISMTLAETFLLLVFMIWYSNQPTKDPPAPTTIEALQAENQRLTKENQRIQVALDDLNRRLAFWRQRFDQPVPGSEEELKKFLYEAGRGKPKCQDENVIVNVSVINGITTLKVVADSPILRTSLGAQEVDFRPGSVITDATMIEKVLLATRDFRKQPDNTECRFDYTFRYQTHDDYYEGNERFEKYFYTAGRTQTKSP
jgi:hypothetical protein